MYEIADINITAEKETDFEAAVNEASAQFRVAKGCRSLELQRSIENPTHYRLVVGWDSVDDHRVTFRESEGFQIWRSLVSAYFSEPPKVEHVSSVFKGF
ncbi:MAG: antibiotic biosynthesis monooxygenase [Spongiibacteraceae bacterium]|nr:antibiotic biosynthesis monooxygenase [Spongiibacteraceae bacterium]